MSSTTSTGTGEGITSTIKNAVNYVSESAQELASGASKEGNKEVAKGNTDASLSDRASAGFSAVGDKIDESSHSAKASGHKALLLSPASPIRGIPEFQFTSSCSGRMAAHAQVDSLKALEWEVWIEVDGAKAPVYGVEAFDGKKVSGYIESKDGAQFSICHKALYKAHPSTDLQFRCLVDGQFVKSICSDQNCMAIMKGRPYRIVGKRVNTTQHAPLCFSRLALTDDEDLADSSEHFIKNLGTISAKVAKGRMTSTPLRNGYDTPAPSTSKVSEKLKKATLSHQASFATPVTGTVKTSAVEFAYLNPYEPEHLHFEFRYLSRELLELKGLIPAPPAPDTPNPPALQHSPSPSRSPVIEEPELESLEEQNARLRRELEELRSTVKREREDEVGGQRKKVKSEKGVKMEKNVKMEVIVID